MQKDAACRDGYHNPNAENAHHQMGMDFENSRGFSTYTMPRIKRSVPFDLYETTATSFFRCHFSSPLSSAVIYCLLLSASANGMAIQVCRSVLSHSTHYSPTLHFATLQFSILFSVNSVTVSVLHRCIQQVVVS